MINIGYYKNLSLFFFQQYYNATKTPFSKPQISSTQLSKILIIIGILGIPLEKKITTSLSYPQKNSSFKKRKKNWPKNKLHFERRHHYPLFTSLSKSDLNSRTHCGQKSLRNISSDIFTKNFFNHQKVHIEQKFVFDHSASLFLFDDLWGRVRPPQPKKCLCWA